LAVTGTTSLTDDLAVDTDTLFVDASADRVGINKNNPAVALDVTGDITSSGTVTGTTLAGTLSTAAQANVTSVGTLSSLAVSGDITIADKIVHDGDTNTAIRFPSADTVTMETGGSERMRIDSSGDVGIGTSSPNLSSSNTALTVNSASDSNAAIEISDGGTLAGVLYGKSTQQVGLWAVPNIYMTFATNNTERMRITSGGDVSITSGNLSFANGSGIDFSASAGGGASSSLLDDYEEGTWTGTLKGSVSDPSTPVTATGYYTKVGNKVFATIAINNATTTGASGVVTVSGLPFTSASTNNSQGSVMCTFYDFDGGTSLVALLVGSVSQVSFLSILDDGDWNDVLHVAGSGRSLRFSITYFV
jgi:hypothetical protein